MKTCAAYLACAAALGAILLSAQTDAKKLNFEVASIKATDTPPQQGEFGGIRALPGGQTYVARFSPLKLMIKLMFKLSDSQIAGAPDWVNTDRFDVRAKSEQPTNLDNLHIMFQNMLIDRFQIKWHKETRTMQAFFVTVDKAGSKMKVNDEPDSFEIPVQGVRGAGGPPTPGAPLPAPVFNGHRVNMEYLCWFLSQQINGAQQNDHPVVDATGLKGFYDFKLTYAPDLSGRTGPNGELPPTFEGPGLAEALTKQLGLKLESRKGPVEVWVIDHVEKPKEN